MCRCIAALSSPLSLLPSWMVTSCYEWVRPLLSTSDHFLCPLAIGRLLSVRLMYMSQTKIIHPFIGRANTSSTRAHSLSLSFHGSVSSFSKGKLKPVQLITETRQGNKVVTRCLHLDDYGFDFLTIQSALQKKFASSVVIPPPLGYVSTLGWG